MIRKIWLHILFVVLFALALWCTPSSAASTRVVIWPVKPSTINLKAMRADAKVTAITKDVVWRTFLHGDKKYLAVYMADFKVVVFDVSGVELRAVVKPKTSAAPSVRDIQPTN